MKIAICDDEKIHRDIILDYLKPFQTGENNLSIFEFESGEDIIEQYKSGKTFDLVFLDVEMKILTGVETAKQIKEFDKNVMLTFVTSHQQYIPDAFILNAFQFLVKPVKQDLFNQELERALDTYRKMKYKYKISYKDHTTILQTGDILFIETFNRRLKAITQNQSYEYIGNISIEEKKLLPYSFIRCHKCFLVNMNHIANIDRNHIVLTNGFLIPISKHYKTEVVNAFNKYVSGGCL